jgi:hypothetical protein
MVCKPGNTHAILQTHALHQQAPCYKMGAGRALTSLLCLPQLETILIAGADPNRANTAGAIPLSLAVEVGG